MARKQASRTKHLYVATQCEVARVFGISVKHFQQLHQSKGCPGKGKRGYDLFAIGDWFADNSDRFQRQPEDAPVPGSRADLQTRKIAAETGLAEIDLQNAQGRFCLRTDVERVAREAFTTLRLLLESIPGKCALQVPAEFRGAVEQDVSDAIRIALRTTKQALGRSVGDKNPPDIGDGDAPKTRRSQSSRGSPRRVGRRTR